MKYIIALICCINIYSQEIVNVNYSVIPTGGTLENNLDVKKSKNVAPMMVGVDDELKKLNFELLIKGDKSYYHLNSVLDFNVNASRLARAFSGSSEFYQDRIKKEVIKITEFSGETFNVKLKNDAEWIFTNETKMIIGYKCFKATRNKILRLKKSNTQVIAWYCPSIAYNFGPKEFGDLPGLIIELTDGRITYLVNKIEFDNSLNLIFKEIKGKIISEEEFDKIYDDTMLKTFDGMSIK